MFYLLLGLAWLVIALTPALVASRQPVKSKGNYSKFTSNDLMQPQPALSRSRRR